MNNHILKLDQTIHICLEDYIQKCFLKLRYINEQSFGTTNESLDMLLKVMCLVQQLFW